MAPINYIAKRAARGFDRLTDEAEEELAGNYRATQSKPSVKAPVSNTGANTPAGTVARTTQSKPSVEAQSKSSVEAPPTTLPEVVVTAPKINNQPAPAYDTNTL